MSEHEEIEMSMAITEICGLAEIHRQTWYNVGIPYQLQREYSSVEYRKHEGMFIDVKKFLEEYKEDKK